MRFTPLTSPPSSVTAASPLVFDAKPRCLFQRLLCLAFILSLELLLIPVLTGREGLTHQVSDWGPSIVRGVVGFAVMFATFAWLKYKTALVRISSAMANSPISFRLLTAHLCAVTFFAMLSCILYGSNSSLAHSAFADGFAGIWVVSGLVAALLAAFAFVEPVFWLRIARETRSLWIWAAAAALVASLAAGASQSFWPVVTRITFRLSQLLLSPIVSGLVVDPVNLVIGTPRFTIQVTPACSGLEGVGLIVAFGAVWLAIFRDQCQFPRALILLPLGVSVIFVLNAVRIAALVLIGNAGAEQIADRGFHSQAGWMMFNLVALSFSVTACKVPWLTTSGADPAEFQASENPTTRWLLPFLLILAAGMLSAALTGDFEWLYPLRFFAGAIALVVLWRRYQDLDWRVGWLAPVAGVVVFFIWIGLDRFIATASGDMPAPLAAASPLARTMWLTFRVLSATVTVPLAEELAFRGFLYRRFLSPDFESVSFRRFSILALLATSLIFGLLHGNRWFAATLAGAMYSLVLIRKGSMGDAVIAHTTTNALLALDVLVFHHWSLW
jgi:exosortase E/protease (VPEID-CTERM system)